MPREEGLLLEWCVMPNHVHVIARMLEGHPLDRIVKSWKSVTARRINSLLGSSGALWQREYHDRYIRDQDHLIAARNYVRFNPVKAGWCSRPEDWRWGSAGYGGMKTPV